MDEQSYKEALLMGPKFQKAIETNIAYHFLESLSEFMDRKVTLTEVQEATKTGWIDK